ncbi:hypothetical protein M0R45_002215 [Rubus argutus]|uniref:Uncharacterized protein n=1 Tax=Rubus argutus TaxID=59490 RepID=A0AAW1VN82_RUBAR
MFIARRAIAYIASSTHLSTRVSKAYLYTSFELAEWRTQESGNDISMETSMPRTDPAKEGLYEAKHQGMALTTDAARDRPVTAKPRRWQRLWETLPRALWTGLGRRVWRVRNSRAGGYDKKDH